jgi:hypothetical protein
MAGLIEYKDVQSSGAVQFRTAPYPTGPGASPFVSANSTYITETEEGIGSYHKTKLVIAGLPITLANTTGISFGAVLLGTFPKGRIVVRETVVKDILYGLTNAGNVTPIDAADGGDFALGTTATSDATLNSTDVNILASTSYDPLSTAVGAIGIINAAFDGRTTPTVLYYNGIIDDADVGDAASDILELNGTIWITWTNMEG